MAMSMMVSVQCGLRCTSSHSTHVLPLSGPLGSPHFRLPECQKSKCRQAHSEWLCEGDKACLRMPR